MPRKSTDIEKKSLYPIIPIYLQHFSSSSLDNDSSSDESEKSESSSISTTSSSAIISNVLQSLETGRAINVNLPEQTEEILEQLRDPHTKFEIRRMKKTSYSYRCIPQKVRESISTKRPTSLGTACGIGCYGVMRIYLIEEDYDSANKWGFYRGDIILDARTRSLSPLMVTRKKTPEMEEETEGAVGFILPVETHCVGESMLLALSDFIQISLLPLSVSVPRAVSSNRAGGLEAFPKWRGVVVSDKIREALRGPSGWIYGALEEKWGVSLVVEDSPFCPEVVEQSGMCLVSQISW
jgi:hypothetical protein